MSRNSTDKSGSILISRGRAAAVLVLLYVAASAVTTTAAKQAQASHVRCRRTTTTTTISDNNVRRRELDDQPESVPYTGAVEAACKHEACSLPIKDVYRPVSCGVSECAYDNLCLANAAGWNDNECQDRCPDKHDPDVSDTGSNQCSDQAYNPVLCQPRQDNDRLTCVYDNVCTALASGVVNVTSDQVCELKCPPESKQVAYCTREYNPHLCGLGKCRYSNQCTATDGAGFLVEQCYPKFQKQVSQRSGPK
jgi:hypothetical protein